uniref:pyocin knob domain-containing protein n=1 Tax=Lentilactobacillus hilgardii TaxID=1588 RepID=UPI00403F7A23
MATPNVGILTNAGKNLIDQVNAGQTKITFSKIIFSSMDNNQLTDDQIKALTTVAPQEIVVNNPEVTLDNNTGETRIRATGNNGALTDGVYVKTYAVYAKDDSGNEILYGITVSPNPNYLPEYDGVTPQAVTYSYKVNISNTSNITFTNSNDIYVSDTDLSEALQPCAKTVDVNQQLDKKVNISDMRKPASDVAGIEEVNTKADDSKVVHHPISKSVTDMNSETSDGLFFNTNLSALHSPFAGGAFYYQVISGVWERIRQIAYADVDASKTVMRISSDGGATWTDWKFEPSVDNSGNMTYGSTDTTIKVADDSKVVHTTDMRKPASDVAGIEEVNAKQDTIGYTPADDSKVVHTTDMRKAPNDVAGIDEVVKDNGNGSISFDGLTIQFKGTVTGDFNNYTQTGLYTYDTTNGAIKNSIGNAPNGILIVISQMNGNIYHFLISSYSERYFRVCLGGEWHDWHKQLFIEDLTAGLATKQDTIDYTPADDSKVVHTTDMRKPASDVAGIEEVNAKQDKLTITPADDSKVAHLSGANNFEIALTKIIFIKQFIFEFFTYCQDY